MYTVVNVVRWVDFPQSLFQNVFWRICLNMVCKPKSSTIIEFMAAEEFGEEHEDDIEENFMFEWGL